jgi:hypothetical protein
MIIFPNILAYQSLSKAKYTQGDLDVNKIVKFIVGIPTLGSTIPTYTLFH